MILFKKSTELSQYIKRLKDAGNQIGFVPTMGALHKGHLALLETSFSSNDLTVCSIFVNPTQFNDPKDFKKYPVSIEQDIQMLESSGADILFLPSVEKIYPGGTTHLQHFDIGHLENILEGRYRPGHFQGVCQVMNRLLNIVEPHRVYMGQKDFQQCMVVKRLLELTTSETLLIICRTQREPDGLAMSSRNLRLNDEERSKAATIYQVLQFFKQHVKAGSLNQLKTTGKEMLDEKRFKTDYVEIADAGTLAVLNEWDGQSKLVALIASFINEVRLIDNMIIGV